MKTDGVVFGVLTPCGDHSHLEWVCPDCGNAGYIGGDQRIHRFNCDRTGREFLLLGLPPLTSRARKIPRATGYETSGSKQPGSSSVAILGESLVAKFLDNARLDNRGDDGGGVSA
jgi:hypothetical protein